MEIDDASSAVFNSRDLVSSIFKHFSLQQRCKIGSACRLWRSVAIAPQFWVDMDFSLYPRLGHAQVRQQGAAPRVTMWRGTLLFGTLAAVTLGLLIPHLTERTGMQIARMLSDHTGVISLNLRGIQPWNVVLAQPSRLTRSASPHCFTANGTGWSFQSGTWQGAEGCGQLSALPAAAEQACATVAGGRANDFDRGHPDWLTQQQLHDSLTLLKLQVTTCKARCAA